MSSIWRDRKSPSKLPIPSAAFATAPVVASYSAIVPEALFATNRSEPDTAIPVGTSNPETGAAFTTAPAVVYSPIWPGRIVTKKRSCGACCADRERCEQDGEQTAPPVLAQPLQCFPPAKLRCDVSANYDKDGSGCAQPTIRAAPIIAEVKPFASSGGGDIVGVDLISCRARKLYLRQCFVEHLYLSEPNLCEPQRGARNPL